MSENTSYCISAFLTILVRKMIEILQGSFEPHASAIRWKTILRRDIMSRIYALNKGLNWVTSKTPFTFN